MKTFNKKKGFTIVELVIVIAVIGVLTAILVPTFVNLTNKANDAADQSLVKNLNTQLRMKEQTEGKNATLTGALEDAKEGGYLVENLTPRGSRDIVWNQEKDEFSLLEGAPAENAYKFWKIYEKAEDVPSTQTYSIFAKGNKWTTVPTLAVGFDAGENEGIEVLNFETTSAVNAIIRTNGTGTVLNVNAANASVHHYDVLDSLTITAIYGESYHEHGRVKGKAVISQGHIEIEEGASVPEVSVESATGAVKVTANEGTTINVDTASSAQTSVVANSDEVFVDGVESSSISGTKASEAKTPELITNEAMLRENANGFAKLGADIVINDDSEILVSSKCVLDLNGHNISFGSGMGEMTDLYHVAEKAELTLRGDGKVVTNSRLVFAEGTLRVEGGKYITTAITNTANTHSTFIGSAKSSIVVNGGEVYSAKCCVTSFGGLEINGGKFVSMASTKLSKKGTEWSDAYAYTLRIANGGTINGGEVYGVQGGISTEGGDLVINDCYVEASGEALNLYAAVQDTIHHIDQGDAVAVSTFDVAQFCASAYYAIYAAGEINVVSTTINGGHFVNKGPQVALLIGNSTIGDGGNRLNAGVKVNGGKFVAEQNASVLSIDYYVGTALLSGGNYNKNQIKINTKPVQYKALTEAGEIIADGHRVVEESDGTWSIVR